MAEVVLQGVDKAFGETQAVRGLDFAVRDGEFFVLLGATGAGKTTTLRLVAGLERPDAGRLSIGGQDALPMAPAQRDVAFVFQQYSLYPHLSVYDNLAFPLRAPGKGVSEAEIRQRIETVAAKLHIESKLNNRATALSGGEMQRVSIGRALVREPACFLMDEPLSSLDAKLREELRVELKHLQVEMGATILYVTHDQVEAMTLADRVGVLVEGELQQVGTPDEVYERPANLAVAQQVGALPVNLFAGERLGLEPARATTVGVRPEHVLVAPSGAHDAPEDRARVLRVERLGAEDVILLEWRGLTLHAAQSPERTGALTETGRVEVEPAALMLFDAEGRRIEPAAGGPALPASLGLAQLGQLFSGAGA
jgi:multiple sugar transport system ATP-binding protein